ncbi:UDP-glycosyltransferase 92A1-like isoform X1 [Juglans microcarpa x Juglans regia]|uniref:UDP-glycosyltransferase 92A1-like isoform X1 n=2 Tax=Juglans microcarpa x Juglans regia TaxID=2249226 RepID=UPI001B7F64F8|nr:UDP-glycosyltransferase 92A1-like isoform X1 [Juglans microcarpa x Juglans regia]
MMDSQEHIVMLPFLAHGHLIPFLALAKQLQQRTGFTITIASTKLNIQYLRSSISTDYDFKILFAELQFCSSAHDLPPNTENTENLSLDRVIKLFYASQSLEYPLLRLLNDIIDQEGRPPLCIISDIFFGWAVDVAKSVGTVNVSFSTGGAYGTLAYVSFCLNLPHRSTDSDEFLVPGFPESVRFHRSQLHQYLRAADGTDVWSKFMQPQFSRCLESSGWLCNSVKEIEPLGLDLLMKYIRLPVWAIGPLLPPAALKSSSSSHASVSRQRAGKKSSLPLEKFLEWLDLLSPNSVLYISFGSQNTIGASQMMQLAIGLEGSGKSFIWVVRPPLGFDLNGEFRAEWLPEGFEERMKQSRRGLIVRDWAPQLDILSHKSTGAFLSHCGWNSALESLSQGVPIVGWPMAAEQAFNSKMLMEEMGVSVELTRGIQSVIEAKEVKRVIESAMDEHGKGGDMRKKAAEVKELIKLAVREEGEEKGSSLKAVDDFVRTVLYKRQEQP